MSRDGGSRARRFPGLCCVHVARGTRKEELVQRVALIGPVQAGGRVLSSLSSVPRIQPLLDCLVSRMDSREFRARCQRKSVKKEAPGSFGGLSTDAKYSTEHSFYLRM